MPKYSVGLEERMEALLGLERMDENTELTLIYSFTNGYEKLSIRHGQGQDDVHGGYEYAGAYHPEGMCEGGGVCVYCGRTL